ncbi:hypothetical protein Tco_0930645 [Tanacetum coccineum]
MIAQIMSTVNQQTLAEEEGELMRHLIDNGPYIRKEIVEPKYDTKKILEPIKDISPKYKNQYYVDIKVMNYILQGISNDIYNSVDACKDAHDMWKRIKRLMHGTDISKQERHSMLMKVFDKFVAKDASKAKKVARNHDPLALVANSYANPSYSHESRTYSRSPQPYFVTHPSSVINYDDDY